MNNRVILIVLDSLGIGELPDAEQYGDKGSNTLGNILKTMKGLNIPNLQKLGIGNIAALPYLDPVSDPEASYGKMAEQSEGKDTTTGHWEITGIVLEKSFPVFPQGFPEQFIQDFERRIKRKVLGNEAASGTEIMERLGSEHIRTGYPIVYTSADSVFQIAAHEEVIPLAELMEICQTAREMLSGDLQVSRVIARPFLGEAGSFYRTNNRHDFSIEPVAENLLDHISESGLSVLAVGKIHDIFSGKGITESVSTKGNMDGVDKTLAMIRNQKQAGLIFTNLVDFDMVYGHRNNVQGYAEALEELDQRLPEIFDALQTDDLLIITADHGCDPTTASTDHSREYVPLLVYGKKFKKGVHLGVRRTFADVGATAAEYLDVKPLKNGNSFLAQIKGGI